MYLARPLSKPPHPLACIELYISVLNALYMVFL